MTSAVRTRRVDEAAKRLEDWFHAVSNAIADAFGWRAGAHGESSALHVLRRQAARLRGSDDSDYTTMCLFLAAACRVLGFQPTARHWAAAIDNVAAQAGAASGPTLGLDLGTATQRFRMLQDDAIDAAGLGSRPSFLDVSSRRVALGHAVNWGLRGLLAHALEAKTAQGAM